MLIFKYILYKEKYKRTQRKIETTSILDGRKKNIKIDANAICGKRRY
jgi:hypothetical protein